MEKNYWFWLSQVAGVGNVRLRKLLEYFDEDPRELYYATKPMLESLGILKPTEIEDLVSENMRLYAWEQMRELEDMGVKFVTPQDSSYPARLHTIFDRPFILYYRGELPRKEKRAVAIVGSRRCSEYGRSIAQEIARQLASFHVEIISGLAMGIDAAAHKGALLGGGTTFGVLAGDVTQCYPMQNFNLYMDMQHNGSGVLSEMPVGTPGRPGLFPLRNRIISGIAEAVIIVEAGHKSGSLITANLALNQNRDIFAVPGRVGDPMSVGCNELIEEGANIVSSVSGLLKSLNLVPAEDQNVKSATGEPTSFCQKIDNITLAPSQKVLYSSLLDFTPRSLESLLKTTKLNASDALTALVGLEMSGLIREVSKNFYVRVM